MAEVLHDAGYFTAHIGKWHLGEPPDTVIPRHQGFDLFAGSFGGRPSSPWNKYARSINPEVIPRIHVSRFYASILKGGREGGGSPVSTFASIVFGASGGGATYGSVGGGGGLFGGGLFTAGAGGGSATAGEPASTLAWPGYGTTMTRGS